MAILRDAVAADLPDIVAIVNEATENSTAIWSYAPTSLEARLVWMQTRQERGFPVLVVEDDERVLGFASFGDFRPFDGYRYTVEHSIYLHAQTRGKGLGKQLLQALIDRAEALKLHVMVGGIDATNAASLALHQRFGFVETGRMPQVGQKFDRWLDLVFMQKILSAG